MELVAVQHGLAAEPLHPLVAAVVGQAAPVGQMEGDGGFPEDGPREKAGKDSPASFPDDKVRKAGR